MATYTHIEPRGRGGQFYFITTRSTFAGCWWTGAKMIITGIRMCLLGRARYMIRADVVSMD